MVKSCWKIDAIDVIEVLRKRMMSWSTRECGMAAECGRKNEGRESGCWRCATRDAQICEVQESRVPNCRQSCRVSEWVVC